MGREVRLVSRQGIDHTEHFPGVVAAVAQLLARRLLLDGEVAVFDEHLTSRCDWLPDAPDGALATLPMFVAFDCMVIDGRDLRGWPLRDRHRRLHEVIAGSEQVLPVRRVATDGLEAWAEAQRRGLEGWSPRMSCHGTSAGRHARGLRLKVRHEGRFLIGAIRF